MLRSLRVRLLAAIGIVAVLSVALALAIGAALTRRAVERNTLRDLSAQADLLVSRERSALLPLARGRDELERFLERRQDTELVTDVPLDGSSPYLPPEAATEVRRGRPVDGTVTVDGARYFFAARLVQRNPFVLIRPTDAVASAWRPQRQGLLVGAGAAILLAGLAAFLLARAIAQPVRRVADAARQLAAEQHPAPVPVQGSRELATLALGEQVGLRADVPERVPLDGLAREDGADREGHGDREGGDDPDRREQPAAEGHGRMDL